eukprot:UN04940
MRHIHMCLGGHPHEKDPPVLYPLKRKKVCVLNSKVTIFLGGGHPQIKIKTLQKHGPHPKTVAPRFFVRKKLRISRLHDT